MPFVLKERQELLHDVHCPQCYSMNVIFTEVRSDLEYIGMKRCKCCLEIFDHVHTRTREQAMV